MAISDWHVLTEIQAGFKDKEGKLRMELLPPEALMEVAQVFTGGAARVAPRNWEKGISYGDCYAAVQRHLHKFWMGEGVDRDHGTHHLAHAIFWCLAMLHFEQHPGVYGTFDDRPRVKKEVEE